MNICCQKMKKMLAQWWELKIKNHSVICDENWRQFFVHSKHHDEHDRDWLIEISYCPFCGTKLPSDLSDSWFQVLEQEYNITDPQDTEYDKVPAEFRTDEWWRKRGL